MVTSPGWGFGLLTGVYLFRTSFKDAPLILASGYSLTCCPWITCSVTVNGNLGVAMVFAPKDSVEVNEKMHWDPLL